MPYIITTRRRESLGWRPTGEVESAKVWEVKSRRAVATLDEAREAAHGIVNRAPAGRAEQYTSSPGRDAMTLPESGGTVGPLPDGTIIEVAPVGRDDLFATLVPVQNRNTASARYWPAERLIDAYNAVQEEETR
jgi:hypothetical protein